MLRLYMLQLPPNATATHAKTEVHAKRRRAGTAVTALRDSKALTAKQVCNLFSTTRAYVMCGFRV